MIPSTELRLKTMMRAMTESILPSIDPEDSLAQEQVGLMMGHINALIQQQGLEPTVEEEERVAITDLANFLLPIADGGDGTKRACTKLTEALNSDSFATLSQALEQLISEQDATEVFKKAAWQPVLDYSKKAAQRGQAWFKPMGF